MKAFLTQPSPKDYGVVQCYIERNKTGTKKLYPEYSLFMKEGDRFLLAGKKRAKNRTSNYLVSMDKGDLSRSSGSYLGKLRSNFIGTEFVVYDGGINPKDANSDALQVRTHTVSIFVLLCMGLWLRALFRLSIPPDREVATS